MVLIESGGKVGRNFKFATFVSDFGRQNARAVYHPHVHLAGYARTARFVVRSATETFTAQYFRLLMHIIIN